jgi:hypothetical protein
VQVLRRAIGPDVGSDPFPVIVDVVVHAGLRRHQRVDLAHARRRHRAAGKEEVDSPSSID